MNVVMRHIFKKNGLILLAMLLVFFGVKIFSTGNVQDNLQDDRYMKEWIVQMYDMDREERETYINNLMTQVYGSEADDGTASIQLSKLYGMNKNLAETCYLIDFAKNGEGIVPNSLPSNYLELLDFYADMEYPRLIYDVSLDTYFSLQEYSIVPFITLLVFVIFFSNQYETQVYTYALTTKNGKLYNKRLKNVLMILCFAFFVINEVFDVVYSGVLFDGQLLNAPVQSYDSFSKIQMASTIGMVLFLSLFSKILGMFILFQVAELLAIKTKNIKDATVGGMFFFLCAFLLSTSFENSRFLPCVQIGAVNWKNVISKIEYCIPLHISYFAIGLGISCVIAVGSFFVLKWERENIC